MSEPVVDELAIYRDEWNSVISRLIARAWIDEAFKRQLIADPTPILHAEGLYFPQRYVVEFFDDPAAAPGEWHSVGRGSRAVHRFPIPRRPDGADVETIVLSGADTTELACCCPCASCTGAVSQETWI